MAKTQADLDASIVVLQAAEVALAARIAALPPPAAVDLTTEVAALDAVSAALAALLP